MILTTSRFVYVLALACAGYIGLNWSSLSPGLSGGTGLCRELQSSGGDDDTLIFIFSLLLIPALLRLFRWRRDFSRGEVWALTITSALVLMALLLASLDCADIFHTAFLRPDPALALALIALPLSWGSALFLRFRAHPPRAS
jgi:hypothetical protein